MRYEEAEPISRAAAQKTLASGEPKRVSEALIAIALHDPDRRWAQETAVAFLSDPDPEIRGAAATCLGHLARRYGRVDVPAIDALRALVTDPNVGGRAEDALEDIAQYAAREPNDQDQ